MRNVSCCRAFRCSCLLLCSGSGCFLVYLGGITHERSRIDCPLRVVGAFGHGPKRQVNVRSLGRVRTFFVSLFFAHPPQLLLPASRALTSTDRQNQLAADREHKLSRRPFDSFDDFRRLRFHPRPRHPRQPCVTTRWLSRDRSEPGRMHCGRIGGGSRTRGVTYKLQDFTTRHELQLSSGLHSVSTPSEALH